MNNLMEKLLKFLSGKKTTIGAIISAIVIFCLGRGYLAQDVADLIAAIMLALGITANIATTKMYAKK